MQRPETPPFHAAPSADQAPPVNVQGPTPGFGLQRLCVNAAGHCWQLDRAGDVDARLEALVASGGLDADERIPYWCELWPASILLCDWLAGQREDIRGRVCLDLGCGLGLTAIVAASLGARVVAMDYEPEALSFARRNAALNDAALAKAPQPLFSCMDWRAPAIRQGSIERMWGGDIVYERRFAEPLKDFFSHALAPHGRIWMAEPQRSVSTPAWPWLAQQGFNVRRIATTPVPTEGYHVTVNLWELSWPDGVRPETATRKARQGSYAP